MSQSFDFARESVAEGVGGRCCRKVQEPEISLNTDGGHKKACADVGYVARAVHTDKRYAQNNIGIAKADSRISWYTLKREDVCQP